MFSYKLPEIIKVLGKISPQIILGISIIAGSTCNIHYFTSTTLQPPLSYESTHTTSLNGTIYAHSTSKNDIYLENSAKVTSEVLVSHDISCNPSANIEVIIGSDQHHIILQQQKIRNWERNFPCNIVTKNKWGSPASHTKKSLSRVKSLSRALAIPTNNEILQNLYDHNQVSQKNNEHTSPRDIFNTIIALLIGILLIIPIVSFIIMLITLLVAYLFLAYPLYLFGVLLEKILSRKILYYHYTFRDGLYSIIRTSWITQLRLLYFIISPVLIVYRFISHRHDGKKQIPQITYLIQHYPLYLLEKRSLQAKHNVENHIMKIDNFIEKIEYILDIDTDMDKTQHNQWTNILAHGKTALTAATQDMKPVSTIHNELDADKEHNTLTGKTTYYKTHLQQAITISQSVSQQLVDIQQYLLNSIN